MQQIQILIYDGFDELDAIAPYEVLHGAGLPTRLVTLGGAPRVTASHGTVVAPHARLLAHVGAGRPQVVQRAVMRDRRAAAQQPGLGQQHHARADARDD